MGISWSDVGDNARLLDELKQACVDLGTETYGKTAVFKTAISWKTDMTSDELIGNKIDECEHSKFAARSISTVDDKEESDPLFEYDTVRPRHRTHPAHLPTPHTHLTHAHLYFLRTASWPPPRQLGQPTDRLARHTALPAHGAGPPVQTRASAPPPPGHSAEFAARADGNLT